MYWGSYVSHFELQLPILRVEILFYFTHFLSEIFFGFFELFCQRFPVIFQLLVLLIRQMAPEKENR